jgi:hypothetical protein
MSSKFFKGLNKVKPAAPPEPRNMEAIMKQYGEQCNRAGALQYQIYALGLELEQINKDLVSVNNEAAARQKLDKEAAEKQSKVEETKQEGSAQ